MAKKKTRGKTRAGHVTEMDLKAVGAWKGNDTEACREAGFKNPGKDATRVFSKPAVQAMIEEKKKAMARESGKKIGRALTKTDAIERALKLSEIDVKKTKGTITGQVAALRLATELEGLIIKKSEDLTKQLQGKSEQELEYFAEYGYWPTVDAGQPGSPASESAGTGQCKPN